jgi:hypothetical protein
VVYSTGTTRMSVPSDSTSQAELPQDGASQRAHAAGPPLTQCGSPATASQGRVVATRSAACGMPNCGHDFVLGWEFTGILLCHDLVANPNRELAARALDEIRFNTKFLLDDRRRPGSAWAVVSDLAVPNADMLHARHPLRQSADVALDYVLYPFLSRRTQRRTVSEVWQGRSSRSSRSSHLGVRHRRHAEPRPAELRVHGHPPRDVRLVSLHHRTRTALLRSGTSLTALNAHSPIRFRPDVSARRSLSSLTHDSFSRPDAPNPHRDVGTTTLGTSSIPSQNTQLCWSPKGAIVTTRGIFND